MSSTIQKSRVYLLLAAALGFSTAVQAQLNGKLFTSNEERTYLDFLREEFLLRTQTAGFNITETDVPEIPTEAESAAQPVEYTLRGIMTRRDGSRSVWLNELTIAENDLPRDLRIVVSRGTLALQINTANASHVLRPGQTIEINSGLIQEQYQRPKPATSEPDPGLLDTINSLISPDTDDSETAEDEADPASGTSNTEAATSPNASALNNLLSSGLPSTVPANANPFTPAAPDAPAVSEDEAALEDQVSALEEMINRLQETGGLQNETR